jgi:luciferase family oxidoreductase group 1
LDLEEFFFLNTVRIKLGLGRSPGGDALTRLALTDGVRKSLNEFPRQIQVLKGHLEHNLPSDHPYYGVTAYPLSETKPELWHLGINKRGARSAAELGISFTFGHFMYAVGGQEAIPSSYQSKPKTNVCVFVVCAETTEEAEAHAKTLDDWLLKVAKSGDTTISSIEEVHNRSYSEEELKKISTNRPRMIVGNPAEVKQELIELQQKYNNDEFLIITNIHDYEAKKKSYELLAELFPQPSFF